MKPNAISLNIQGPDRDENIEYYPGRNHLADDTSDKVLQIFHFSLTAEQLQACADLFGIRHGSVKGAWHLPGESPGGMENSQVQSVGYSRI